MSLTLQHREEILQRLKEIEIAIQLLPYEGLTVIEETGTVERLCDEVLELSCELNDELEIEGEAL